MENLLSEIKYFLSVESLDSRIVPTSSLRPRHVQAGDRESIQSDSKKKKNYPNGGEKSVKKEDNTPEPLTKSKPLWNTLEFKFYYVAFIIVVPWMLSVGMSASNETNPNYPLFEGLLSDGWLFGRKVDNSDAQYKFFRDNLFLLVGLMVSHVGIKKVVLKTLHLQKIRFDGIFGLFFLAFAHGVNSIKVLGHLLIFFAISRGFRNHYRIAVGALWIYGISSLFINDKFRSFPFSNIWSGLSFLDHSYRGIIKRWDVFYNVTLLRLLSFNLDYLERYYNIKHDSSNEEVVTKLKKNEEVLNERERLVAPHPITEYSFANYISYVLYTPLYIAGPIISFNDYLYQTKRTLPWINRKNVVSFAIKVVVGILTMEFILHFAYVVAVSKRKAWEGDTPFQISMIGLLNLNIIWLKLMIPWRLFRLWAMLDETDTPENMIRCVDNNYSAVAFWRAWHRSYNKWVLRYIYIPLGGSKNRILTSLTVFSFVAIWHDIQMRLLLWGWLIVLFILPEVFATKYFAKYQEKSWFRHLCAVGAVINIWMMMIANLFGFCLGSDGTTQLLKDIFLSWSGIGFFTVASGCIFIAVQMMFEQREAEKRNNINVKC